MCWASLELGNKRSVVLSERSCIGVRDLRYYPKRFCMGVRDPRYYPKRFCMGVRDSLYNPKSSIGCNRPAV